MDSISARVSGQSTWQGIGFVMTLPGCRQAGKTERGQTGRLHGIVSAVLKVTVSGK